MAPRPPASASHPATLTWDELDGFAAIGLAVALGGVEPALALTLAGLRLARVLGGDGSAARIAAAWERRLHGAGV